MGMLTPLGCGVEEPGARDLILEQGGGQLLRLLASRPRQVFQALGGLIVLADCPWLSAKICTSLLDARVAS